MAGGKFADPTVGTFLAKRSSTSQVVKKSRGYGIDVVGGLIYINLTGTPQLLSDVLATQVSATPTTTLNIGAPNGATVSAVEYGNAYYHKTVLTLTALPLTLLEVDGLNGAGVKIYDFPTGAITLLSGAATIAETTTSILANTLNASKVLNVGVGTTTQVNAVLATTEQNLVTKFNVTASATINVAGSPASGSLVVPANFNGSGTAIDAFFNVGVATDDDIDDDATATFTGTVTLIWTFNS